jgi:hypothetical protein
VIEANPGPDGLSMKMQQQVSPSAPSDSGFTFGRETGRFDGAFRQEVAAKILEALAKGYVTHKEVMRREARKRNLSVEQLLAAYLARTIMDKVDSEYI